MRRSRGGAKLAEIGRAEGTPAFGTLYCPAHPSIEFLAPPRRVRARTGPHQLIITSCTCVHLSAPVPILDPPPPARRARLLSVNTCSHWVLLCAQKASFQRASPAPTVSAPS